jgi:spoIIIJ-associated protein
VTAREVVKAGRTRDEAVAAALAELGVTIEQVDVEELEEPTRGWLGLLGGREARVRVRRRVTKADAVRDFLSGVAGLLSLDLNVAVEQTDDSVTARMAGGGGALLIGRRGQTLAALTVLAEAAATQRTGDRRRVVVDVEGYLDRRRRTLEEMARRAAHQARRTGREVRLDPMPPAERRIVHLALQQEEGVATESTGHDPFRYVVVRATEP